MQPPLILPFGFHLRSSLICCLVNVGRTSLRLFELLDFRR